MKIQRYKILLLLISLLGQAHADAVIVLAELSLDDAVRKVIGKNRLLDAETKNIKDRNVHVIKVLTGDGRVQKHKIDAETGNRMGKDKH